MTSRHIRTARRSKRDLQWWQAEADGLVPDPFKAPADMTDEEVEAAVQYRGDTEQPVPQPQRTA